jgi:hypothetical protein
MSRTKSFPKDALPWAFTFALIMIAIPLWAGSPKTAGSTPQVVTIEATKTVRIVVGGKNVAVLDSKGLHVEGDINATGAFGPGIYGGPNATIPPDATPLPAVRTP